MTVALLDECDTPRPVRYQIAPLTDYAKDLECGSSVILRGNNP